MFFKVFVEECQLNVISEILLANLSETVWNRQQSFSYKIAK
jgi:hypothetical protein